MPRIDLDALRQQIDGDFGERHGRLRWSASR
jgi:hypothetical protein